MDVATPQDPRVSNSQGREPVSKSEVSLPRGARLVGLLTLLSRVLGLLRDMLMAAVFGAGSALDAFTLAFRIPNLARRLFGEGAFTSAFLPGFVDRLESGDQAGARELSNAVFVHLCRWLIGLMLLAEVVILIPLLWWSLGPETRLLLMLLALLMPYVVLICLTAHQSAVLHALHRFGIPALAPVILNSVWLIGLPTIVYLFPESSHDGRLMWLCGVILLSGMVQLGAAMIATWSNGWGFRRPSGSDPESSRAIFQVMWPVILGMSIAQMNTLVDSLLAWWLTLEGSGWGWLPRLRPGTASALYLGQRLQQFPLGIIGVTLGTVLFPRMSRHVSGGNLASVRQDIGWGLRLSIALCLPASLGLMLLAMPITEVLFQRGAFDQDDASLTAQMVAAYGCSVWAAVALLIVHRGFYSLRDRETPLKISLALVGVNLVLNLGLVSLLQGAGLAWATTLTTILHLVIAIRWLESRMGRLDWRSQGNNLASSFTSATLMGVLCLGLDRLLPVGGSATLAAGRLGLIVLLGGGAYVMSAWFLKHQEIMAIFSRGERPE